MIFILLYSLFRPWGLISNELTTKVKSLDMYYWCDYPRIMTQTDSIDSNSTSLICFFPQKVMSQFTIVHVRYQHRSGETVLWLDHGPGQAVECN